MSKTFTTPKGSTVPLTNLKGKDYLMVAYRLIWFTEEVPSFDIHTEFLLLNDDQAVCKATITVADETGKVVRKATATKRETKKDFPDFTEKAETSSIGRALAILGYGTQFALADMDEGARLADTPLAQVTPIAGDSGPSVAPVEKKRSSFKKLAKTEEPKQEVVATVTTQVPVINGEASGWE